MWCGCKSLDQPHKHHHCKVGHFRDLRGLSVNILKRVNKHTHTTSFYMKGNLSFHSTLILIVGANFRPFDERGETSISCCFCWRKLTWEKEQNNNRNIQIKIEKRRNMKSNDNSGNHSPRSADNSKLCFIIPNVASPGIIHGSFGVSFPPQNWHGVLIFNLGHSAVKHKQTIGLVGLQLRDIEKEDH